MNGARKLAISWVCSRIAAGSLVLDVGSGDGEVTRVARGLSSVMTVDICGAPDLLHDLSRIPWPLPSNSFDVAVATYSLQHFIGWEAAAWLEIARVLKPGGLLLATGRFRTDAPAFEMNRRDPLRSDNRTTWETMAVTSGLKLMEFCLFEYDDQGCCPAEHMEANAFAATALKEKVHGS